MDGRTFWASQSRAPFTAIIKLRSSRTFFLMSLQHVDCICLKEESQIHLGWIEGE